MTKPLCIYHVDFNFVNIRSDYLSAWLERLAAMGYNAILWELEDKVQWEVCPEAVWPEAMSKADFRKVLEKAASLGLEAIPLLQTIGHGEYVLKHDAYRPLRELADHHDCYCTENPEVRRFLKRLIGEYLDLFGDIRHFHLGGDEAYVFASCPVCSAEAERLGRNALYARHILDISEPIRERGARAGIWSDMVLNHPEQMAAIPTDLDIWDWNYWDVEGPLEQVRIWGRGLVGRSDLTDADLALYPEILGEGDRLRGFYTADMLKRNGYEVFLCGATRSAGDSFFCPRTELHTKNIAGVARKTAQSALAGVCVTDWAVRLNNWDLHRSLLPVAPALLADSSLELNGIRQAAARDLFRCDASEFIQATDLLSGVSFPFSQAHSTGVQWNRLKDSLPAPAGYLSDVLREWEASGRLENERLAIDETLERIQQGFALLAAFCVKAVSGLDLLNLWTRAAGFQLWQARMAREILNGRRTSENIQELQRLKAEYEAFLCVDQTPGSAAQNAGLVYDTLIDWMSS